MTIGQHIALRQPDVWRTLALIYFDWEITVKMVPYKEDIDKLMRGVPGFW